jgi:hypothetical protein
MNDSRIILLFNNIVNEFVDCKLRESLKDDLIKANALNDDKLQSSVVHRLFSSIQLEDVLKLTEIVYNHMSPEELTLLTGFVDEDKLKELISIFAESIIKFVHSLDENVFVDFLQLNLTLLKD